MKKTELKNLHSSMRYLKNTKRQNSHRITWRGGKVKPHWQRPLITTYPMKICEKVVVLICGFKKEGKNGKLEIIL